MSKEFDLYGRWEREIILEDTERCLAFRRKSEPRYQACAYRLIDEAAEQVVEKTIQDMDPEERKKLEKSGPVTVPPLEGLEGSEDSSSFATQLEAKRYVLKSIVKEALKNTMDELQRKKQ